MAKVPIQPRVRIQKKASEPNDPPLEAGHAQVTVSHRIGKGAHASVHRGVLAWAGEAPRVVAVKSLPRAVATSTDMMDRLATLYGTLRSIEDPTLVEILDFGRFAARPLIVSELVAGKSLRDLLRARPSPLPPDIALHVAAMIAQALARVLSCQQVHGALTPRDVLLSTKGEVKVTDFGLVRILEERPDLSRVDTIAYMAPEIVWGGQPDASSDVFALGVILYEACVGPRFKAATTATEAAELARRCVMPAASQPIHASVEALLRGALDAEPKRRFPSAEVFGREIARALQTAAPRDRAAAIGAEVRQYFGEDGSAGSEGA